MGQRSGEKGEKSGRKYNWSASSLTWSHRTSNLYHTINSVYIRILSVHLEAISSEQLHLYTSNASEYCVGPDHKAAYTMGFSHACQPSKGVARFLYLHETVTGNMVIVHTCIHMQSEW